MPLQHTTDKTARSVPDMQESPWVFYLYQRRISGSTLWVSREDKMKISSDDSRVIDGDIRGSSHFRMMHLNGHCYD